MNIVVPIQITTPDGVERTLRATLGARKRIRNTFKCDMQEALNVYGDGALPEIAFSLMHDAKGKPPEGITAEELAESIAPEDALSLMSAILAAFSQGKTDPNEVEALLTRLREMDQTKEQTNTGSTSGDSVTAASELPIAPSSGGDSSSVKSTLSAEPSETTKLDA